MSGGRDIEIQESEKNRHQEEDDLYRRVLRLQVKAAEDNFRLFGYNRQSLVTMLGCFNRNRHLDKDVLDVIATHYRNQFPFPSIDKLIELFHLQKAKGLESAIATKMVHPLSCGNLSEAIGNAKKEGKLFEFLSTDILFCHGEFLAPQWFFLKPLGMLLTFSELSDSHYANKDSDMEILLNAYRSLGEEGAMYFRKHYDQWFESQSEIRAQLNTICHVRPAIALLDKSVESGEKVDIKAFADLMAPVCRQKCGDYRKTFVYGGFSREDKIIQIVKEIRDAGRSRWSPETLALFDAMMIEINVVCIPPLLLLPRFDKDWEKLRESAAARSQEISDEVNKRCKAYEDKCKRRDREMVKLRNILSEDPRSFLRP
ncbi:MAG TPA: hypothetical protein VNC84_02425 [Gammaproteobacteria bacterium]|jgi:hypothetical protein|nr:hypothetical protein [Gammaproteobacteria bacterium]